MHSMPAQADAAAFVQWQRQMAVDRSRGHFFKSLYTAEIEEDEEDSLKPVRRKVCSLVLSKLTVSSEASKACRMPPLVAAEPGGPFYA